MCHFNRQIPIIPMQIFSNSSLDFDGNVIGDMLKPKKWICEIWKGLINDSKRINSLQEHSQFKSSHCSCL